MFVTVKGMAADGRGICADKVKGKNNGLFCSRAAQQECFERPLRTGGRSGRGISGGHGVALLQSTDTEPFPVRLSERSVAGIGRH